MRQNLFKPLILLFATLLAGPVAALGDYSQREENSGATMHIASMPVDADGKMSALLEIELKAGWKTYWREPGAYGIPPQITITEPQTAQIIDIRYPVPKQLEDGDYLDIGYDQPVAIPFTIQLPKGATGNPVQISVLIGVCRDICIPFQSVFTIDPQAGSHAEDIARALSLAEKTLPEAPSDDFKVDSFSIAEGRKSVDIDLIVPEGTKSIDEVIIAGPPGNAYTLIKSSALNGTQAKLNIDAISLPETYDTKGQTWHVVVKANGRVMESPLVFPKS